MGICIHYRDCDQGSYELCSKDYVQDTCKYLDTHIISDRLPNFQLKIKTTPESETELNEGDIGLMRFLR